LLGLGTLLIRPLQNW